MHTRKDKQGFLLIGVVATAVIGIIALKIILDDGDKPGSDNCVGNPIANTVIVIDRSDAVTQQTLDEIRARAMAYVSDSVKDNERVTVYSVDNASTTGLAPLVSLCRPRRHGSRLTENVKALEKQFRANYQRPLDSILRLAPGSSSESPLAQALTDISLGRHLNARRNTLMVFSDMLENTDRFSMYRCASPNRVVEEFRRSRMGAKERPQFKNTMVRLNIIPRLDQPVAALECRDKLWVWFFGDNPGEEAGVSLEYLPGGPAVRPTRDTRSK